MLIVEDIIKDYMETHSRLTIVGLGTFLTKEESDQLLFTEFVMDDDGVLFDTLVKSGVCEVEATAMIENFVEIVHKRLDAGEEYYIEGAGTLRKSPIGIRFNHQSEAPATTTTTTTTTSTSTAPNEVETPVEMPKSEISGAAKYQDFEARIAEPKRRRIDFLMLAATVLIIFAVCLFAYSLVIKWQMGELELPEKLDDIMYKIFGSL